MTKAGPIAETDDRMDSVLAERDALAEALQKSREHEALLSNELQHRVRNTLAVIRSIFSRTVETSGSIDEIAMHFPGRLDALARYQAQSATLHREQTFDLATMIFDELVVFAADDYQYLTLDGPEVRLPARYAAPLGLALHELTTNSVKFGALSDQHARARLSIVWERTRTGVVLEWSESGVAIVNSAPAPTGFGRDYIEQALPYQVRAQTKFEILPGGIKCRIELTFDAKAG